MDCAVLAVLVATPSSIAVPSRPPARAEPACASAIVRMRAGRGGQRAAHYQTTLSPLGQLICEWAGCVTQADSP
jgi:hypothetical protein